MNNEDDRPDLIEAPDYGRRKACAALGAWGIGLAASPSVAAQSWGGLFGGWGGGVTRSKNGMLIRERVLHSDNHPAAWNIAWSNDSRYVATKSRDDENGHDLWDTTTGTVARQLHGARGTGAGQRESLAFSPNDRWLLTQAYVWDLETGGQRVLFEKYPFANTVAYSADGSLAVAAVDYDPRAPRNGHAIVVFDTATWERIQTVYLGKFRTSILFVRGKGESVLVIGSSAEGNSYRAEIRIVDVGSSDSPRVLWRFDRNRGMVFSSVHPSREELIFCTGLAKNDPENSGAWIIPLTATEHLRAEPIKVASGVITDCHYLLDGRFVLLEREYSDGRTALEILDRESLKEVDSMVSSAPGLTMRPNRDGQRLAIWTFDKGSGQFEFSIWSIRR
jgi:hypothetical protein